MKRKRLYALMLVVIMVVASVSGCKKDKYEEYYSNTVLITKGEKVKLVSFHELAAYGTIDTFDLIDDNKMIDYNYSVGGISVRREESSLVNGMTIRLVTSFNNFLAYDGYKGVEFMTGPISEALIAYDFKDVKFLDMSGNSVETETAIADDTLHVVIIDEEIDIAISGEIVYYSDNVKPTSASRVKGSPEGVSYIIFK